MTSKTIEVTAAIIQRDEDGRILIAQRGIPSRLAGKWEFPGGQIKSGEDLVTCLEREIWEELGIRISVGEPFHAVLHDYGAHGTIRLNSFFCTIVEGEPKASVHADLRWVVPRELLAYDFAPADIPIVERIIRQSREAI